MSRQRSIEDYLYDILESIDDIKSFTNKLTFSAFEKDRKTTKAVIRCLEVIGEAVKKLPIELKDKYKDVPWKEIAGMRDKLIHEYFGIDLEILWTSAKEDLEPLRATIVQITADYKK